MSKLAVVIATNRPESFKRWCESWAHELSGIEVYAVEDAPSITPLVVETAASYNWKNYAWDDIDRELGTQSWVIPRRTSAIKSFGFYKAYKAGHEFIWTLDDDCFPEEDRFSFLAYPSLMERALRDKYANDSWFNTIDTLGSNASLYPRGYPYGIRHEQQPVMIHHGMWSGVPDLDGVTALEFPDLRLPPEQSSYRVPTGKFFPMCGMNLAFRREIAPAMYFGLQGHALKGSVKSPVTGKVPLDPLPFDRFDDIWAGLFAKKVCDHLGYAVTSGSPSIVHTKESDPTMRVIKEAPGIAVHEQLWKYVRDVRLVGKTVSDSYCQLADSVHRFGSVDSGRKDYWTKLAEAMHVWTELLE